MEHYKNLLERYQSGQLPWDDPLPPPEVMAYIPTLPPGRALDLGCGTGRSAIYMAELGWDVDAVDFIPQAIEMARNRAKKVGTTPRFHLASVTDLSFLSEPYHFVLDIGCLHGLPSDDFLAYYQELKRLLTPGGTYLLFARLQNDGVLPAESPLGLDEIKMLDQFSEALILDRFEYGLTQVNDTPAWKSAWFWFTRRVD